MRMIEENKLSEEDIERINDKLTEQDTQAEVSTDPECFIIRKPNSLEMFGMRYSAMLFSKAMDTNGYYETLEEVDDDLIARDDRVDFVDELELVDEFKIHSFYISGACVFAVVYDDYKKAYVGIIAI